MLHRAGQRAEIIGLQKAALQRSFPGDDLPGLEACSQAALLALLKMVFHSAGKLALGGRAAVAGGGGDQVPLALPGQLQAAADALLALPHGIQRLLQRLDHPVDLGPACPQVLDLVLQQPDAGGHVGVLQVAPDLAERGAAGLQNGDQVHGGELTQGVVTVAAGGHKGGL